MTISAENKKITFLVKQSIEDGAVKSVPGFPEGRYYVSRKGTVYSNRITHFVKLYIRKGVNGIFSIPLKKEDEHGFKSYDIAELILAAFDRESNGNERAHHKNFDLDDLESQNLEWIPEEEYRKNVHKYFSSSKLNDNEKDDGLVKYPDSDYELKKYDVSDEDFDMLVAALMPFYHEFKGINLDRMREDESFLYLFTGEGTGISKRDIERLKTFFNLLEEKTEASKGEI